MEPGSKDQGKSQAKGVRQLLGQGECLVAPLQGLVWIAKIPQGPGCKGEASHPRVLPVEEGQGAVLLGIVEGNRPAPSVSRAEVNSPRQNKVIPSAIVGLEEESWVLYALGQAEELLRQLMCRL